MIVSLVVSMLAAVSCLPGAAGEAVTPAHTSTAVVGEIEATVLASATLKAAELVNVGAQVSGQVQVLHVTLGQHVVKGDLIAEIDATPQKNELRIAEAALRGLAAQLRAKLIALQLAEAALRRQRMMLDEDASAPADHESAEGARDIARADVAALEAQIEQARILVDKVRFDLGQATIRAPISGTVIAIVTKQGQTLNSVQQVPTIVRLARLDTVQVKAQISEVDVVRVKQGQAVYFTLMGEPVHRYHARIEVVESMPEKDAQDAGDAAGAASPVYYNALFSVPNPDGALRIGMTAQVSVIVASAHKVVTIARAALPGAGPYGRHVLRVSKDGVIEERTVRTGLDDAVNLEIVEGLRAGERVLLPNTVAAVAPDA